MVWRGLTKRCARCGAGRLFDGWFRLRERCPRCGYRFEREEGFFTGAYLVNLAVTEGLAFVALMVFVFLRGIADIEVPLLPVVAVLIAFAVLAPIAFYPFAKTTWAAIDLAARPLEPVEEAEAATAAPDWHPPSGIRPRRRR